MGSSSAELRRVGTSSSGRDNTMVDLLTAQPQCMTSLGYPACRKFDYQLHDAGPAICPDSREEIVIACIGIQAY